MEDIHSFVREAVGLLSQLVSIQGYSREESAKADFLQHYLSDHALSVQRVGNNLWCEAFPHEPHKPTLLLNSHMDTVPAGTGWTYRPFQLTAVDTPLPDGRTEQRLYGLGSNDAGASLVCLLQTFRYLSQRKLPYNLVLGISCEEEVTGKGGIDLLLSEMPSIDFALVGEPTGMRAAIAEKGLMVLDCTAHGTAGHAAHLTGDNAIYKALRAIEWVRTTVIDSDDRSPVLPGSPKESLLGPVRMTVTVVRGGTRHNVIPDTCDFTIDVRVNDRYDNESLFAYLREHLESFGCTVQARSFRLASSGISPTHPVVERCRQLGMECFGSPTLSDQSRMHFPSLKMGPGDSSRSHTADEYILPDEIRRGLEGYIRLLEGLRL